MADDVGISIWSPNLIYFIYRLNYWLTELNENENQASRFVGEIFHFQLQWFPSPNIVTRFAENVQNTPHFEPFHFKEFVWLSKWISICSFRHDFRMVPHEKFSVRHPVLFKMDFKLEFLSSFAPKKMVVLLKHYFENDYASEFLIYFWFENSIHF